jgi:creatinine amidohydrolase
MQPQCQRKFAHKTAFPNKNRHFTYLRHTTNNAHSLGKPFSNARPIGNPTRINAAKSVPKQRGIIFAAAFLAFSPSPGTADRRSPGEGRGEGKPSMKSPSSIADTVYALTEARPLLWESLTWPEIAALRDAGSDMVLLPIGATEPVNTDSVFATACCMYASAKTRIPMLPTLSYGCSLGHTDRWPGTLSLYPETLAATIREIAEFLIRTNFRRLLIVNSHWGNTSTLRTAIDRIRFDHAGEFQIGLKNSFEFTRSIWNQFIDDGEDFHANRAETALMLFLDPDAVRKDKIEDDPDRTPGKVFTYVVPQTSKNGLTGYPSRATAEDGRKLFIEMGEALTACAKSAQTETPPLPWKRSPLIPSPGTPGEG